MQFKTTEDIKNHFKALSDAGFEIPGVYNAADQVIDNKFHQMVREGNKNNLDIDVNKVIKTIGLKNFNVFAEVETAVSEYFAQFSVDDKLNECYNKISLTGTHIDGKRLEEAKKEFSQSTDFTWGEIIDLRKNLKFNIGRFEHFEAAKTYRCLNSYETEQALKFIIKHFFDVELRNLSNWDAADMGVWKDYGNGLQGKMFKNGTFEIKHNHNDILAKELYHYYRSKYSHYFIQI